MVAAVVAAVIVVAAVEVVAAVDAEVVVAAAAADPCWRRNSHRSDSESCRWSCKVGSSALRLVVPRSSCDYGVLHCLHST